MTEQASLWKREQPSSNFAELCNALYERELHTLANMNGASVNVIQNRLKSLPYYIQRTARLMLQCTSPMTLDVQNASWSAKQLTKIPLTNQDSHTINQWYAGIVLTHGLVVPIAHADHIVLDCIDRVDINNDRFRTNAHGWFSFVDSGSNNDKPYTLLKPNKRIMAAACAGHCWVNNHKSIPVMPTLRELLLSCTINWRNFKESIVLQ